MFPLYPHEVAYDAERVRIAAAVGDEELAEHGILIAERRASLNPDVPSCAAAAAHARGIWNDSAEDLVRAVSLYRDRTSPSRPCVRARRPRPSSGATRRQRVGNRRTRQGADDFGTRRGELGCCTRSGPASPSWRATASPQSRPAGDRVGRTDRSRVHGRQSCRGWVHQPGDRRQALRLPAHCPLSPAPRLREARSQLPCAPHEACRGPAGPIAKGSARRAWVTMAPQGRGDKVGRRIYSTGALLA